MSIDNDFGKYKFGNNQQKAVINLIFTNNWLNEHLKALLHSFKITNQQFNILRILRGAKTPISTLQLRERMLEKMSDTSRMAERLVKKKLILKSTNQNDKRLVDISIAPAGLELLQRIDLIQSDLDGLVKNLDNSELETLNRLLDKIRNSSPN